MASDEDTFRNASRSWYPFQVIFYFLFIMWMLVAESEGKIIGTSQLSTLVRKTKVSPVTEDGIRFPGKTNNHSPYAVDQAYRKLQGSSMWEPFIVTSILEEFSKDICFMSNVQSWTRTDEQTGQQKMKVDYNGDFKTDIATCTDAGKPFMIAPLSVIGEDSAHAELLFINKTQGIIERYDPNGHIAYQSVKRSDVDDIFRHKHLDQVVLPKLGDLKVLKHPGFPVQLAQNAASMGYQGFCQTWIFYYLNVKLLNPHIDDRVLDAAVAKRLSKYGMNEILGFLDAKISQYEEIFPPSASVPPLSKHIETTRDYFSRQLSKAPQEWYSILPSFFTDVVSQSSKRNPGQPIHKYDLGDVEALRITEHSRIAENFMAAYHAFHDHNTGWEEVVSTPDYVDKDNTEYWKDIVMLLGSDQLGRAATIQAYPEYEFFESLMMLFPSVLKIAPVGILPFFFVGKGLRRLVDSRRNRK